MSQKKYYMEYIAFQL